jgi:carboxypeptidase Taq
MKRVLMLSSSSVLSESYEELVGKTKEIFILHSLSGIIHWDMETKMPPRGTQLRSQQLALLEKIGHRMITDPEIGKFIDKIRDHNDFDSLSQLQKRNVHLIKKEYDEATKLPEKLVVETARQYAITVNTWKKAKAAMDWDMFKPELEKLYNLKKEAADILMEVKGSSTRYDALIDLFEPGMTSHNISEVFSGMRKGLQELIEKVQSSNIKLETSFLKRKVPIYLQERVSEALVEIIEYDTKSPNAGGRIDETEHPFTTGYYDDIRITTHYYEENFCSSVFSVLHEGGHAIYEQGLPSDWMYQPVGTSSSMGIHESQSRFVENMFGRSPEFWSYFFPKLNNMFGGVLSDVNLDQFILAVNRVEPSKIRIEADEVTYGLHIIIRFEMERDLLSERLTIDELPQVWSQKYREYLGVEVEHDSEGVMQDIHWSSGIFGYFPSYALGNIYGGQMLEKLVKDVPDYRDNISQGVFKDMKKWFVENVHRYGNLYDPAELIKVVTGEELRIEPFLNYLHEKYSKLYGF